MNKKEIVDTLAGKLGVNKKDAEVILSAFTETMKEALAAGNEVFLKGFGKFMVKERNEREGRNPRTGEALTIPASKSIRFKASETLKETVNA